MVENRFGGDHGGSGVWATEQPKEAYHIEGKMSADTMQNNITEFHITGYEYYWPYIGKEFEVHKETYLSIQDSRNKTLFKEI